jgi:phosphate transport system substrate-binding protein
MWILASKDVTDGAKATALTRFLWWALHDGQKFASDLGYAPMPAEMITKAEAKVKAIVANGKLAFPNK